MNTEKLGKFFVANLKRTAQMVYPLYKRIDKINEEIDNLLKEKETLKTQAESLEAPIKLQTNGLSTANLIYREVITTDNVDKNGNKIKVTKWVLYPEDQQPKEPEPMAPIEGIDVPPCDSEEAINL